MNHQIRRLSGVMALALVALLLNLSISQFWQAETLRNRPDNTRTLLEEYGRQRGAIYVGNTAVAKSVETGGTLVFERTYPKGPVFAPATGYYSLVYGATGLERVYSSILSGRDDRLAVDRLQQLLAGRRALGGSVLLTLDAGMQQAAYDALAGRSGAVVALDSATGKVLALVSSPSFDPSLLSSNAPADIRNSYESLSNDAREPLSNRPLTLSLPPGSTFKLVVAAAALMSGDYTPESLIPGPATLKLPQSSKLLRNWQGKACSPSGELTLRRALEVSCNTAFAWLGMQLGAEALRKQAEAFGFNNSVDTPLVAAASVFPATLDQAQTAMSAIGQFDVRATTLQMAMVIAAIANRGVLNNPQLVQSVRSANLNVIESWQPRQLGQAVTPEVAAQLVSMMRSVVTNGTASSGRLNGIMVGAKTGTAESGTSAPPHAWFVANATVGKRTISVAVVVQNGGGAAEVSGNGIAGPIAAKVILAAFK